MRYLLVSLAVAVTLWGCSASRPAQVGTPHQSRELFEDRCSRCHGLNVPLAQSHTKEVWREIVDNMADRWSWLAGSVERQSIADYLFATRPAQVEPVKPPPKYPELIPPLPPVW